MTRKNIAIALIAAAVIGVGYFGWREFTGSGASGSGKGSGQNSGKTQKAALPTATVQVAKGRVGRIAEQLTVYGSVIPAPSSLQTITLPFQSQIMRVGVDAGQKISAGDVLVVVEPSPDTALQLEQARNTYSTAQQALQQVQGRFKLQLATNDQVLQAQQAEQQAKAQLDSLQSRQKAAGDGSIRAEADGLVNLIPVHEGQIVNAGAPLVEIVEGDELEVQLGIEPEDIELINESRPVFVSRPSDPDESRIRGTIRRLSKLVNANTRLVDAFVTVPPENELLLGESIVGLLDVAIANGLLVPRDAVLPEGGQFVLYTVRNGKAVKNTVMIGLENDTEIQIVSPSLENESIVVRGNYVLRDGMPVTVEPGP